MHQHRLPFHRQPPSLKLAEEDNEERPYYQIKFTHEMMTITFTDPPAEKVLNIKRTIISNWDISPKFFCPEDALSFTLDWLDKTIKRG
jgi:hypothetical protein